jgi:hypothetical protein
MVEKSTHIDNTEGQGIQVAYSDWSPTPSRVAHGRRAMLISSTSSLVSRPSTKVDKAFVITPENSSCKEKHHQFAASKRRSKLRKMSKFSLSPQNKLFSLNMNLSLTARHFLGKD